MANIVGIDLGTAYSGLAHLNAVGKPEIVPNAEGERITRSAIYIDGNRIEVGEEAINAAIDIDEDKLVQWVKRHMEKPVFPERVDGREWSPSELSSFVLKKLKNDAEIKIGPIQDVVITVPAYFDEVRRQATIRAGELAGLNVIGIVNEPTAAAIYYAKEHSIRGKSLIFDLGGGTFDVTIADVNGLDIDILTSRGNHELGGHDFDLAILDIMRRQCMQQTGVKLENDVDKPINLEIDAEEVKKRLSNPRKENTKTNLYSESGERVVFEICRSQFEEAISSLTAKVEMLVETTLDDVDCEPEDIENVILVGGSTRIPVMRSLLATMFGKEPLEVGNVDECVALGAALYAGLRKVEEDPASVHSAVQSELSALNVGDVTNFSYGTICVCFDEEIRRHDLKNDTLIAKNTPIPASKTATYYTIRDEQDSIEVKITQSEDPTTDPDHCRQVWTKDMALPKGRPAGQPIEVTYTYDINNIMHCTFHDVSSGRKCALVLDFTKSDGKGVLVEEDEKGRPTGVSMEEFVIE